MLITAAESLTSPLAIATYRTLIGLLAVTGVRVGEAIAADRDDLDLEAGVLVVEHGKFGKSRALPLHASTVAALGEYLATRDRLHPKPKAPSLFISTVGTRLLYENVHLKFQRCVRMAGLRPRSANAGRASPIFATVLLSERFLTGTANVLTCRPGCRCCPPTWVTSNPF